MPEIKTEIQAEMFDVESRRDAEHDGRARLIALAAVITTLVAALTGFMQARALRIHDASDVRAERLGALSLYASAGNRDQAEVQIERYQLLEQLRRQQANAQAFARYGGQPSAGSESDRWSYVAGKVQADTRQIANTQHLITTCPVSSSNECSGATLPVISPGGWYSAEQDPNFPTRYQQNARWGAYFLSAQRDNANERADAAENRFVHLAAALTMFAVAVFLFGYSLTPQGRTRRPLFVGVATLFVVVGGGWTIYSLAQGIPNLSTRSSRAYADGLVQFNDANYAGAEKDLKLATKLRPDFADAWGRLAQDRAYEGVPALYVDNEVTQINGLRELRAAAYADEQAIGAGSQSALVRADLGANLLYIGLLSHNGNVVEQSRAESADAFARFLAQSRQGRHLGESLLFPEFNTAEADLVDGSRNAQHEYHAAVQRLLEPEYVNTVGVETPVATALTDLNLIGQTRRRLTAKTNALAQAIVYAVSRNSNDGWDGTAHHYYLPSGHDNPHFQAVQVFPDPGHLQYMIGNATQFDPSSDTLSVQWEYLDPVNHNWEVLPDISGAVTDGNTNTLIARPAGAPAGTFWSSNPSFLGETTPHTCLPPGQYRAVLYADGRLAGVSATATGSWGALHGTGFGAIGVAFCRPSGWRGFATGAADAETFLSPDGSSGAWLFSYPAKALGGLSPDEVMGDVVKGISSGNSPFAHSAPAGGSAPSYFMNFAGAREQLWKYPAGRGKIGLMWSATGTSPDHEVYVGLVHGPSADTQAGLEKMYLQLHDILLSYSQL